MTPDQAARLSTRQFFATLKWLFVYNFKITPFATSARIATTIVRSLSPLFNALIFARLLDGIIKIATNGSDISEIVPLLLTLLMYNVVMSGVNSFDDYLDSAMGTIANNKSSQFLFTHIHTLGIQTLENAEVANKVQRTREQIGNLTGDFDRAINFLGKIVALVGAAAAVVKKIPFITLLVFLAAVPRLISNRYFLRKDWKLWRDNTENRRHTTFIFSTLTETSNLQEISITAAFEYLRAQYRELTQRHIASVLHNVKQWEITGFLLGTLQEGASIFGYFSILKNLFFKFISVGDATFQMRALDMFESNISSLGIQFTSLLERCVRINEIREVLEMKPAVPDGPIILKTENNAPHISFKNVDFAYPNAVERSIKSLTLDIKPGEKIAIVGENGAGKTTLVKLLCRFYRVSDGSVMINDNNINDLAISSWYQNIGVLFQDYNTYSALTLRENIFLGDSQHELDEVKMKDAATKANIDAFVAHYKDGFEQVLSEKFKGGTRPSTGQWQKIAIARFFYRNSPVVIFDEPTASIDAVAESEIFGQIYDFFKKKTVIIISHRFSTVRNADKIYVLDKGEIVEHGSHAQLMRKKGKYYKAFTIQAKGYQ